MYITVHTLNYEKKKKEHFNIPQPDFKNIILVLAILILEKFSFFDFPETRGHIDIFAAILH
jgi:hypothetical protein